MTHSKFVDSSFPQCNVHTGVQGGCLAFTRLDGSVYPYYIVINVTHHGITQELSCL